MLKNIDPLLSPELLADLQAMGHGDVVAIVNRNFPAAAKARRLRYLPGVTATALAEAILSVLPIDSAASPPVFTMSVPDDPNARVPVQEHFQSIADSAEGHTVGVGRLNREEFYEAAQRAYVVVATGESRVYGCFLITKGVIH